MKDKALYQLLLMGASESIVDNLYNNEISIFDLFINYKRHNLIISYNRKTNVRKAATVLKRHWSFEESYFDCPAVLIAFGANVRLIKNFYRIARLPEFHRINEFLELEYRLGESEEVKYNTRLEKINKCIEAYKDWEKNNFDEILKYEIMKFIYIERETSKAQILDVFQREDLVIELLNHGYIFQINDNIYFPSNLKYENEQLETYIYNNKEKFVENNELKIITIEDVMKSDIKHIDVLKQRIYGLTLEEIAITRGVTREAIRGNQKYALRKIGFIENEKHYAEIFSKYYFSKTDFTFIFGVSNDMYGYLNVKYNRGKEDPKDFILKMSIPREKKEQYFNNNGFMITSKGEVKRLSKAELVSEILFKNRLKTFSDKEFHNVYNSSLPIEYDKDLIIENPRSIEGLIVRNNYAIQSNGRKFRYYNNNLAPLDITALELLLDLPDGLYNMNKIFRDNFSLMLDLDIRNEYELHNIYKRLEIYKNVIKLVKLNKAPEFTVGVVDKLAFMTQMIKEFNNENIDELVKYLDEVYGLKSNSTLSYLQMNFRDQIENRIIKVDEKNYDDEVLSELKKTLSQDIYLKSEILNILLEFKIEFTKNLLGNLDFYVTDVLVYRKKYGNAKNAIKHIYFNQDRYIRGETPVEKSHIFTSYLIGFEKNYEIFTITDNVYLTRDFLESKGITISLIQDFVESIKKIVTLENYFSVPYLTQEFNFHHKLFDDGFEMIFYDRILTADDEFRPVNRVHPNLFLRSYEPRPTVEGFILNELLYYPDGVTIEDLIDDIKDKYQVIIDPYKIKASVNNSDMFYSETLDKIYPDKEKYLDEVYNYDK